MKILVPVKRVPDPSFAVRVRADGTGVELAGARMVMNPFDEIALEEAVRLKEKGVATEVVAVSIGGPGTEEVLRSALALGADRVVLVEAEGRVEPLAVAKILAALVGREAPRLVLMGKQAIDDDSGQVGQMLAGLVGWAQATFASSVSIAGEAATVVRETDAGLQTVEISLPAVITADLRLNSPRFAALPKIMAARRQPITRETPAGLGVEIAPRMSVLGVEEPPARAKGEVLSSVAELVEQLKARGMVS